MDFQTICRVCITRNSEMLSIFDDYKFHLEYCQIFKVITDCASVEIQKSDGFSERICLGCLERLSQAYGFKKLCEESHYKFRNNLIVADGIQVKSEFSQEDTIISYGGDVDNRIKDEADDKSQIIELIEVKSEPRNDDEEPENNSDIDQEEVGLKKGRAEYKCELCGEKILNRLNYSRHIRGHVGEREFKCNYCKKIFTRYASLRRHIKMHTGKQKHKCQFCERKYVQLHNLQVHIRTHTGEKPFKCEFCEKEFADSSILARHLIVHTGVNRFECDFCKRVFTRKSSLKGHIKLHMGEQQHKCNFCEKKYTTLHNLVVHIRKHTGEKPFKCEFCEKQFADDSSFARHIKMHTGTSQFICEICPRIFTRKNNLDAHIRRHKERSEKLRKCDVCDKEITSSNFSKHKKMHNKELM